MAKLTPMMEQYFSIKKDYKYALLFFRLGDFYELFYEDAEIASRELDIVLTGKSVGTDEKAPMCGVPFHAADGYIAKLVNSGFKVAVCEQMEDPSEAKGIVKREVVRVITPGTIMDTNALDSGVNNFISCIFKNKSGFGVATCDITTSSFLTTEFGPNDFNKVIDEIAKFNPTEIICNSAFDDNELKEIKNIFYVAPNRCDDYAFEYQNADICLCNHFDTLNLFGFGLENKFCAVSAAGALLAYAKDAQRNSMQNISSLKYYTRNDCMILDINSRRNLQLTKMANNNELYGTLQWVIDNTKTPMGSRLLIRRIEQPLIDKAEIDFRLDGIQEFKDKVFERNSIRTLLKDVFDMERIMGKIAYGNTTGKDLLALRGSLKNLPEIKQILEKFECQYICEILRNWDNLSDVYTLLCESLSDEMPTTIRNGGVIRDGYNEELDKLRLAMKKGSEWLLEIESEEREKTGIKNLRVKYNKIHGYFIEISNSYLAQVPDDYIRRQTLVNGERFINPKLKELEEVLLSAEERVKELEVTLFNQIVGKISQAGKGIKSMAALIADVDFVQSMANVADKNNYSRPVITNELDIKIVNGRHPVIEQLDIGDGIFIPNDTNMVGLEKPIEIITGPNMAGKSTYMRQVALIVLMAQIGSFVPADSAEIGITDRIFTRVGASDNLATGQSTFMVEMVEVANILNNATQKSLLVLDEIGRGTSTFDGMSIAWAVIEYIAKAIKARTMFSTHYQELTSIEEKLDSVINYCVNVKEQGDNVVFLRKIKRGVVDKSYGVHVAKLAGVPNTVVKRANEVLNILGSSGLTMLSDEKGVYIDCADFDIKKAERDAEIVEKLMEIDLDDISPKAAWAMLSKLQSIVEES